MAQKMQLTAYYLRNVFQNGVNTLSKMVFKNFFFFFLWSNNSKFVRFGPYDFVQISPAYDTNILFVSMYGMTLYFQYQHWQR